MPATHNPQATATILSRRRSGCVGWLLIAISKRLVQNQGPFDEGHHPDQDHQHAERERERNRTSATAPQLLFGENDARLFWLFAHRHAHANTRPKGNPNCEPPTLC